MAIIARLLTHWMRLLLFFSLGCGCFAYGFSAGLFKIFPYTTISNAWVAAVALVAVARPALPTIPVVIHNTKEVFAPIAIKHAPIETDELILVSGGAGFLKEYHKSGCLAWIMDRAGNVRHTWEFDPSVWSNLKEVNRPFDAIGGVYPVGMHLFDNGDLLVNYQGEFTFPFGVGMARFDKDSNLLWKKELFTHHWFSVAEDGRIFVPSLRVLDTPFQIGKTEWTINSPTTKMYEDLVLILDPDGNVLDTISMLSAIVDSGFGGLLIHGPHTDDPLHINDVRVVDEKVAASHSGLVPGDLLVSFRNINSVGILDPNTKRFKWMSSGAVIQQHSPRFYRDGVMVLDNVGGVLSQGGTQLVNIDQRGIPSVLFPKPGMKLPESCRTPNSGHLDVHRDGNHVLMALTRNGSIWEVDLRTGELVWEYVYVHPHEGPTRQSLFTAKYVYEAGFLSSGASQ